MRPSGYFFALLTSIVILGLFCIKDQHRRYEESLPLMLKKADIVQRLQLTDLCLSTEATYTRHSSQADLYAPFADHPGALEHFPSGTIITVPPHLKENHAPIH